MDNSGDSSDIQSKARASAPIAARIAEESRPRPYRWGYFQGAVLIPWSLLLIVGTILEFPETAAGTLVSDDNRSADGNSRSASRIRTVTKESICSVSGLRHVWSFPSA
jgi:hypothetical protein